MKKLFAGIGILGLFLCSTCVVSKEPQVTRPNVPGESFQVVFYNVENLFDTEDDPAKLDDDFTPSGKYAWDEERFITKIHRIGEVLGKIDPELPGLVGLCEVENRAVLESLVKSEGLSAAGYKIIHQDSPDERGIDVALLYKPGLLNLVEEEFLEVRLPDGNDPDTRDILHATFKVGGELLHVYVNHWPSRGKGQEETEINRVTAAGIASKSINGLLSKTPDAKILVMGDFNDYPGNKSIGHVLDAGEDHSHLLYDYMAPLDAAGDGSYWYQGDWGTLDQFMGSWSLVESTRGLNAHVGSASIFKWEGLFFTDGKGVQRPDRTYAGESYKGGYSDHLPVILRMNRD